MQSPPFPRYLVPPRSNYSPQHHVLKHPQLPFLPQCQRPSFTPIKNNRQNYSSKTHNTQTDITHSHWNYTWALTQFLCALVKLGKATVSFTSVCPSVWNNSAPTVRIFMKSDIGVFFFSKICRKNSTFIAIRQWQRALCMNSYVRVLEYLAQLFLEWWMFHNEIAEETQIRLLCFITFPPRKSFRLWENVEICCKATQVTDDNIIRHMRFACWVPKAKSTHSEYVILTAFGRQQRLCERVSM